MPRAAVPYHSREVMGPDESFLIARARRGDAGAFEEIVRLYQRRVYGVALRIVRTHDVADDVAQEAFLRAWRSLERFELGRPFGPWVCRIAANLAVNHVRSPRAREEGLPEGHAETRACEPGPLGSLLDAEAARVLDDGDGGAARRSSAPCWCCAPSRRCRTRRSRSRSGSARAR